MKTVNEKTRRLINVVLVGCVGLLPARAQSSQETLKLTLEDALEVALSENPTIRVADQEVTKKGYAKKGTYAALFPQIDLVGNYQRTIEKQVMYMGDQSIAVGRDNTWSGGLSASMPLISVSTWKSLKISAYDVELSVEQARSSRIELIDHVKRAFYSVLLAGDAYDVYKEVYDNAIYNHREIKQKYEQGLAAEYDLIRANVNVKNAEPNLYDAENSIILAHWQLKALLGLDLESNIECIGRLSDYKDTLLADFVGTTTDLTENTDLKQLDIQRLQLEKTKQMQIAQYYPSLSASFNYQWNSMANNFKLSKYKWDPYSTLGVNLTIPIFSGGKRYSNVKQTQISLKQLSDQREDIERNLRLSVKQYTDQMNTCIKQYSAATAGVAEAEKSYLITMKRYETGEGTLLEINDAQLSLTQSQLNLSQSIYNYLVAKSSLEKVLGNVTAK